MDKMFLVKEFKDKDEVLTHFKGLCYFGNLIRKEPIFSVYNNNYLNYVNEIFADVNLPDEVRSQEDFVKRQMI
jgi:hypothetical protein